MRHLLIFAGLSVAAAAGCLELWATLKASEARAATAAEWSGDDAQFVAVGLTNDTLVIAMPDQLDVVGCDALIDRAITNPRIVGKIEAAGFDAIQCGDRRKELGFFTKKREEAVTAEIKTFISPNICNVPGCGNSTEDYHFFVCQAHLSEASRAQTRKYLDRLHRRASGCLLTPQRPDSGVTHDVVLHITPEMRERYAARHRKPLMSDERRGIECGEFDLGEIE